METTKDRVQEAQDRRKELGFISVDYDEPNQKSYRGYNVKNGSGGKLRFDTGDFLIDSILLKLFVDSSMKSVCCSFTYSSSFDHFFMDGDDYKEVYVNWDKEGSSFEVLDHSNMSIMDLREGDRVIMKSDMETFDDYISYWKSWKEKNLEFYNNWREEMDLL